MKAFRPVLKTGLFTFALLAILTLFFMVDHLNACADGANTSPETDFRYEIIDDETPGIRDIH